MDHPNQKVMREAIEFGASQDYDTVGAIIVRDEEIIAKEAGSIFQDPDATGYSEINAIRKACKKLGSHELDNCWLYTTHEPCPMCMSAICWAKMEGIVYAAKDEDMPEDWLKVFKDASARQIIEISDYQPKLVEEFMREEAKEIGH